MNKESITAKRTRLVELINQIKLKNMPYEKRKAWVGFIFILPWFIGFVFLFLKPLLQSLWFTFNDIEIREGGYSTVFVGIKNYMHAFTVDPEFIKSLVDSFFNIMYQIPIILIFSLFIAYILNQNFKGRILVRAVFFLPVIIASGVVIEILRGDVMSQMILSGEKSSTLFQVGALQQMLLEMGLGSDLVATLIRVSNNVFELSWKSGLQILMFLAGLQTVPRHMYEASSIEGSTAWETFWKITFPLISPIIILNIIYSITDYFIDYTNSSMKIILKHGQNLNLEYSATLAWLYFILVFTVIGIVYKIIDKRVTYI